MSTSYEAFPPEANSPLEGGDEREGCFVDTVIFPRCHDCGRTLKPSEKVYVYTNKDSSFMLVICRNCKGLKQEGQAAITLTS